MNILVCISNVPDTTARISFSGDGTTFNDSGVQFILNPYDEIALSRAIELCEGGKGTITVIHVGEVVAEPALRKALAIGADHAVRIDAAPADSWFTANQVAVYAKDRKFDLLLTGRESIDYNGNAVGAMIASLLDIPSVSGVKKLDLEGTTALVEREIEGGKEIVKINLPVLITCSEGVAEPKIPNMRGIMSARTKPLEVVAPVKAEPRVLIRKFELPPRRGAVQLVPAEQAEQLIGLLAGII